MMNSTTYVAKGRFPFLSMLALFALIVTFAGTACSPTNDASGSSSAKPTNVAPATKPTETEAAKTAPVPAGKEVKPADGPALKSITPAEGTILGGVLNGLATSLPQPDPEAVKAANASGTVTVEIMINEKGEVVASSVVSGPQPLWSAAAAAARKARFEPPLHNGKPVKVAGVLTYDFAK